MKVHINYAEGRYYNSQKFCTRSAIEVGFDRTHSYGIGDIDYDFRQNNHHILSQKGELVIGYGNRIFFKKH